MDFEEGFRADLVVDERVVVELKSVEKLSPVHCKQLLTYLRLMKLPVGLLINFGGATLKEGLKRIVNKLETSASPLLRVNQSPLQAEKMTSEEAHAEARGTRREEGGDFSPSRPS